MMRFVPIMVLAGSATAISCAPAAAATCEITSDGVNFGNYDTLRAEHLLGAGNIEVVCDAETGFTISLDQAAGSQERQMTSGSDVLLYNLYTDASMLMVWENGTAGTTDSAGIAIQTIYGRIPARQNVQAGLYADVVAITIAY